MQNICLKLNYSGKNYHGWQIQQNALSVQEVFQDALKHVIKEEKIEIKGCSRTDAGVHANEYYVSFKSDSKFNVKKLPLALNTYLPKDVAVHSAFYVPLSFHARYSCTGKEYVYKIWNNRVRNPFLDKYAFHYWYNLDVEFLNNCAKYFVGTHDFRSFCTLDARKEENLTRTVDYFNVYKENNFVIFKVKANGFLYNMVRIMVGTLFMLNKNKTAPSKIKEIMLAKDRSKAGPTAVPYGLYLNKVFYEGISEINS